MEETKKYEDTPLNKWVKGLPFSYKKLFLKRLYNNQLLWDENDDINIKRRRFNNYRYQGILKTGYTTKIIIFIVAKSIDETLEINHLFPEINPQYPKHIIPELTFLAYK